eukprot:m.55670 g.55670  ORF g.55670 m.55670 type:complete len:250 (+) comp13333_c0_seq1:106-855(+)
MSSFRKAEKSLRRNHKERAQPYKREKLGILEKGKDWKERRDDFHRKERRLTALTEKAKNRNPDEFYFGMIKSKTKDGVHVKERDSTKKYTADELKLIRTQDLNYITARTSHETNKIEELQANLHLVDVEKPNTHTVFVDSEKEAKQFDPVEFFQTAPELVDRKSNRPRLETLATTAVPRMSKDDMKKAEQQRRRNYDELLQRMSRKEKMAKVANELQLQKSLMRKGRRDKVGKTAEGRPVFKWRRERKN